MSIDLSIHLSVCVSNQNLILDSKSKSTSESKATSESKFLNLIKSYQVYLSISYVQKCIQDWHVCYPAIPSRASQVSLSEYDCQQVNKLDGIEDSELDSYITGWDSKSDLLLEHLFLFVLHQFTPEKSHWNSHELPPLEADTSKNPRGPSQEGQPSIWISSSVQPSLFFRQIPHKMQVKISLFS